MDISYVSTSNEYITIIIKQCLFVISPTKQRQLTEAKQDSQISTSVEPRQSGICLSAILKIRQEFLTKKVFFWVKNNFLKINLIRTN